MFKNYLGSLRNAKENRKIESSVNEMKSLIQKMDIMLDSVGKSILSKENLEEFKIVVDQQEILSFCNYFVDAVNITILARETYHNEHIRRKFITKLLNYLEQTKEITTDELVSLREQMECFNVSSISMNKTLLNRCDILHNKQSMKKIVEILSQEDYFRKLISVIF